jgi:GldM second domain
MKKPTFVLFIALLISIVFIIVFACKIHFKNNTIVALKERIERDSISFEKDSIDFEKANYYNNCAFKFMNVEVRVIPESRYIAVGDSFRAQVFLSAFNMVKFDSPTEKPFLLIGDDIDTNTWNLTGHIDTISQNSWNPSFAIKTNKIGLDSLAGVFYIPNPMKNKLMNFPFKIEYQVVDREKYLEIYK